MAPNDKQADPAVVMDDDAPGPPISVPDSGDTGEGGKLKMIVQLVKKCLGVKDIATMRLSLPASLLEPIPNLEYWQYLDRPDLFAAINDEDDDFMRMLAVIRFVFTKDLKFIHGKICKPYNSVLGEHFRAHWDIIPVSHGPHSVDPPVPALYTAPAAAASVIEDASNTPAASSTVSNSDAVSVKSRRSSKSTSSKSALSPSTAATSLREGNLEAQVSNLHLDDASSASSASGDEGDPSSDRIRVVYLTEQVSHHPPVSAYYASCPAQQIEMAGVDQIAARVSGTTLKVAPGNYNKGIYINLTGGLGQGEKYHITHPIASVNGLLRGSFYLTVGDSTIITRTGGKGGTQYRTVLEYKEESWLGRAMFKVEGVIHTYQDGETDHEEWTKVKHVPKARVVAYIDGSWKHLIRWKLADHITPPTPSNSSLPASSVPSRVGSRIDLTKTEDDWCTLVDLSTLKVVPKVVRPLDKQMPNESRKLWEKVTTNLTNKQYSDATREKVTIEQHQRDLAAERKKQGTEFVPHYFKDWEDGCPTLTEEGRKAVEEEIKEDSAYHLVDSKS